MKTNFVDLFLKTNVEFKWYKVEGDKYFLQNKYCSYVKLLSYNF